MNKTFKLCIQVVLACVVVAIVPLWFLVALLALGVMIQLND